MSLKKWFGDVKTSVDNHEKKVKSLENLHEAQNKISMSVSVYECHNWDLDKKLGIEYCQVKYCPEDWLGSIQEDAPDTQIHKCPNFDGTRCSQDCPKCAENNAFFDARDAFDAAKQAHINSLRSVFKIRAK